MDVPATEEQIRSLAYGLWEEAGCPEGRAAEFWAQAEKQLGVEVVPSSDAGDDETPAGGS
ncbi:hypothetical protein AWB75_06856 [Caballeronia catudaia]|uniref:DUF2934 domain-containing protein n=1 Tax=Caballeronia catudaia TaxID=1777136 RepID=A0A158DJR7_9BURK|nr:DUF2934 domain-containing protein [Caballeronia catudaia]SAK94834.1 hypothetical protein AWB75_06856 [Caballeronia catudaia]